MSISLASSCSSSPTISISARAAAASIGVFAAWNCAVTQPGRSRSRGASKRSTSPPLRQAFASGPSAFSSAPTSASTVSGAGEPRYPSIAFASAAFQASTPSTATSLPPPANSPSALQAATASSPEASAASSSSVASGEKCLRSLRTASSTFGRSVPAIR